MAALFAPGFVAAASAADFNPAPGTYTADTSALKITGTGVNVTGQNIGGVAVFAFNNINIPAGATIVATGTRPFKLAAVGSFTLGGIIDASGKSVTNFDSFLTPTPTPGGAGGGFGGTDATQPGGGTGGGAVASAGNNGAGGGGFGGRGAAGGCQGGTCPTGQNAGAGGNAYGSLDVLFQGGSGGGGATVPGSSPVSGGGGGGAVAIFASAIIIPTGAKILADGGNGAVGGFGASGGGSGGGILLHANVMDVGGLLSARGGQGGAGGCCGDGGGGGGGRIAYQYSTLISAGTTNVVGGTSGTASDPTGFTSGGASPNPVGAAGVVTQVRGALASTAAATGVSQTAATLNGFINPNGGPTTYHFDFGATTAYGADVPGFDVFVGSDAAVHAVSQTVAGLAANTTYHYRLVATDALGLVTTAADMAFTTAPNPPPTASATVSALGSGATVNVSCSGVAGQICAGHFAVTAHRHTCGKATTAVSARAHKPKCKPKTTLVIVGGGTYSAAAGQTQTLHFSVNSTGKSLLTQFYKLPSTWTFAATSGNAPGARQVTFAYQRITATADDFNLKVAASSALVKSWFITGIPSGGTVKVGCHGRGCPFGQRTFKHQHRVSILAGARLSVGDTVRITISAPNRVGMVDTVTIKSLDAPKESFSCLPPGARAPSKCRAPS